ncbi:PREDICTED: uncharacterized protein LOC108370088 [Rhagoletis zephyria]|uniref:uncharacterized protein LOC108370088 n=1 Tax=Rhagoletis zephyria TaxID=28612 RepID=UPI00081189DA|nr:PREDICTED: uncharacterized protein LOC108370088 [Rhagoletis zephyria]
MGTGRTNSIEEEDIKDDIGDINNSIPDDFTSAFVTPRKVHNSTLSEDDMLYESNRNNISEPKDLYSAFDETGTFRSKSSQIWDPHPQYIMTAFGHELHLVLHQDSSFIPKQTFSVIRILNNRTEAPRTRFQPPTQIWVLPQCWAQGVLTLVYRPTAITDWW